jgi:hypothetical protein
MEPGLPSLDGQLVCSTSPKKNETSWGPQQPTEAESVLFTHHIIPCPWAAQKITSCSLLCNYVSHHVTKSWSKQYGTTDIRHFLAWPWIPLNIQWDPPLSPTTSWRPEGLVTNGEVISICVTFWMTEINALLLLVLWPQHTTAQGFSKFWLYTNHLVLTQYNWD